MAQIVGCLEGMSAACRVLDYPIVSGNVSLYNESKATGGGSAILPTPAIGGVGLMEDWTKAATIAFKAEGEKIVVLGDGAGGLGQSLWLRELHGREEGPPPSVDLAAERRNGELIRRLIAEELVTAVHDVSDGGLAVAIAEMALAGGLGAEINEIADSGLAWRWFREAQERYVVTTKDLRTLVEAIGEAVPHHCVGTTGLVNRMTGEQDIGWRMSAPGNHAVEVGCGVPLADLRAAHEGFFPNLMRGGSKAA